MASSAMKSRLDRLTRRFRSCTGGSVAVTTGVVATMLFVAAGGAIDYTSAITKVEKAQRAMDATVLSLARRGVPQTDLQIEGETMFSTLLNARGVKDPTTGVSFVQDGKAVRGVAQLSSKSSFLGMIGIDVLDAGISAAAIPPERKPIEISLVLDVSGSMDWDLNGKKRIDVMKTAVNGMFDTLEDKLPADAEVSVALVPYSTSVNIAGISGILDTASVSGAPAPAAGTDVWAAERYVAMNGLDFTLNDASPATSKIPFVIESEMPSVNPSVRITPLNKNRSVVKSAISSLSPSGWTAGHLGMAWGVYTLSNDWKSVWPQDPAKDGEADKIIVILSDGEFNTTHRFGVAPDSPEAIGQSYAYFDAVCDFAKSENIVIYAVALSLDATKAAKLGNCVGNGGSLFTANTATELENAFEQIAINLGRLRLSS